jgi:4-hydroxyproline epimerase
MHRIRVIDSHTEGEPTRVIIEGGPDLGDGSLADRRTRFQQQFDRYRSAVVNEPRGSDVFVGALLVRGKLGYLENQLTEHVVGRPRDA